MWSCDIQVSIVYMYIYILINNGLGNNGISISKEEMFGTTYDVRAQNKHHPRTEPRHKFSIKQTFIKIYINRISKACIQPLYTWNQCYLCIKLLLTTQELREWPQVGLLKNGALNVYHHPRHFLMVLLRLLRNGHLHHGLHYICIVCRLVIRLLDLLG